MIDDSFTLRHDGESPVYVSGYFVGEQKSAGGGSEEMEARFLHTLPP